MNASNVRFGLIGYGAWGQFHAGAIEATANAELVAIAAKSDKTCDAARTAHPQAEVYADFRQMLGREDLDAIVIVLPSHLHHEVASAVLSTGRHLLLEKPMALSLKQCDELLQLAKDNQCLLAIGHEMRFSSLWSRVKEMVDDGFVGDVQYILVELSRRPYRLGSEGWRYDINRVGDWILEEPIHFFDLARWYLSTSGEPKQVYAMANSRQPDHPELQDNFSAIVTFDGGAYAVITQTLSAFEHHQVVKLTGTKGALWASWSGPMDRTLHPSFSLRAFDGENVETIPITKTTGEVFELEDQVAMMVRAIRERQSLEATGNDGKWSVAMCLAARQSVDMGRPVAMEEVMANQ